MASADQLFVVLDAEVATAGLNLSKGAWVHEGNVPSGIGFWYNGGLLGLSSTTNDTTLGAFVFTFHGVAISVWGRYGSSQPFRSALDEQTVSNSTAPGHTAPSGPIELFWGPWYDSSATSLDDGQHTITISDMPFGLTLDLFLVQPGPQTLLTGQNLLVDDANSGIIYSGTGWKSSSSPYSINGNELWGGPVQNTLHVTSTPGDSVTFAFTGTELMLYGIMANGTSASFSYTIDNGNEHHATVSPSTIFAFSDFFNLLIVDTGSLLEGEHTVTVTLTDTSFFWGVDYFVYRPSFTSLATMPKVTPHLPVTSSSTSTSSSSSSTGTAASVSVASKTNNTGAIAGGVVGGVVVIAILAFLMFWLLRRKRRAEANVIHEPQLIYQRTIAFISEPFPGPVIVTRPPMATYSSSKSREAFTPNAVSESGLSNMSYNAARPDSPSLQSASSGMTSDVQRRINQLEQETARLARIAEPPVYTG
ncbi:hypothetical protein C8J56DRAFT_896755 [Mycena floridula]|nr:hypothetical protein C8J56DRAFT_896755 [Mycena floridula]